MPGLRHALRGQEGPTDRRGRDGSDRDESAADQQPPTRPLGHGVRCLGDSCAVLCRETEEPVEQGGTDDELDEGGTDGQDEDGVRVPEAGQEPDGHERPDDPHRRGQAGPCDEPDDGADRQRHDEDEDLEGELVVRAEQRHDEVLGARRLEVDDLAADREDRRRRAGKDAGQELAHGECRAGRNDADERRSAGTRTGEPVSRRWQRSPSSHDHSAPGVTRS